MVKSIFVGTNLQTINIQGQKATVDVFCTHWHYLHLDLRKILPTVWAPPREGFSTLMRLRHWALWHGFTLITNIHLFKASLTHFLQCIQLTGHHSLMAQITMNCQLFIGDCMTGRSCSSLHFLSCMTNYTTNFHSKVSFLWNEYHFCTTIRQ